jgi:hypothetical protein
MWNNLTIVSPVIINISLWINFINLYFNNTEDRYQCSGAGLIGFLVPRIWIFKFFVLIRFRVGMHRMPDLTCRISGIQPHRISSETSASIRYRYPELKRIVSRKFDIFFGAFKMLKQTKFNSRGWYRYNFYVVKINLSWNWIEFESMEPELGRLYNFPLGGEKC